MVHLLKIIHYFSNHPTALQFILYYDDIEVCNPLGSSAGIHKLGKILCQCVYSEVYMYYILLLLV